MALYTELQIYQAARELARFAMKAAENMPRSVKILYGHPIRDLCVEIVILIARANKAQDKVPYLDALLERKEALEFLMRICVDLRYIGKTVHADLLKITTSIGMQAHGWRRSYV